MFVYALKLKNHCYFVGQTLDPWKILKNPPQHIWIQLHKPLSMMQYFFTAFPEEEEERLTKDLMFKYGIESVRGGPFQGQFLTTKIIRNLQLELTRTKNVCFHCARHGHYRKQCRVKTPARIICMTCGEEGHYTNDCE